MTSIDGWRYLERMLGRAGFRAMRDRLDEDWQRRFGGEESARVPHLALEGETVEDGLHHERNHS